MFLSTSPEKFTAEFNQVVPGSYRSITAQDVRDMIDCGLIRRYSYYSHADLETVRAILRYEQLRQKRVEKPQPKTISDVRACKLCGNVLPYLPVGKHGRHKEYCSSCEPVRAKKRYLKWRQKRHVMMN